MVDGIHGSHVSEKSLSGTDVGSGLFTTDMLLTSLKSKTIGRLAMSILGYTDNSTRNTTLVLILASKESGMWTTIAEGNTETLRVTKSNISAEFSRSLEQGQRQKVSGDDDLTASGVNSFGELLVVSNIASGIRVLSAKTNTIC